MKVISTVGAHQKQELSQEVKEWGDSNLNVNKRFRIRISNWTKNVINIPSLKTESLKEVTNAKD